VKPFSRVKEARKWVDTHASGWVSVIQGNAVLLMNPWCHGDMRLVGNLKVDWNDSEEAK
jgi:hypothetical protein